MGGKLNDSIKQEVRKLIADIIEIPENELKEDAKFADDLGVDSMMALEMLAVIEKKYRVVIPEEEIPNIRTLNNVYSLLEKALSK
ncbi:MAG: acyl carrier protein [Candidatus Omnitrophota bacterium]|nr:MAG: acyl carrier protein [Candidatus Omnitrophota bacterium]